MTTLIAHFSDLLELGLFIYLGITQWLRVELESGHLYVDPGSTNASWDG